MIQKDNLLKIAVIGGGASSTLLLAHLGNHPSAHSGISVDIYDRAGRFARGVAYSTTRSCHLLNVLASNMSGLADDKDHFVCWAKELGYAPQDFVPRKVYGDYLEFLWDASALKFPVQKFTEDVRTCERVSPKYRLNGKPYDSVILASGNVRALEPKIESHLPNYHPNPWTSDFASKDMRNIALIGSGLTAVDTIMSLIEEGFSGSITIFSRHGTLPMINVPSQSWELSGIKGALAPAGLMKTLRANIREAKRQNIPWQSVLDALRPITNNVWQSWDNAQKASFDRHLKTLWNVHRHRMAPQIAEKLDHADIKFICSRIRRITAEGLITEHGELCTYDAVINCMGYAYDEPETNFEVSYKIGPARFGELFETTAIPEIRQQAKEIVEELLTK